MTSRRSRRRPSRTGSRCAPRPSSRASTWRPCSGRRSARWRCRGETTGASGDVVRPMMITGRVPLLLLLAVVAVVLRPEASTVWLWLLVVVVLTGVDLLLAPATGQVGVERLPVGRVRAGQETVSAVRLENLARRRLHLEVRDAWQPSAGARDNRHRLRLGAGERTLLRTALRPVRRGELHAF